MKIAGSAVVFLAVVLLALVLLFGGCTAENPDFRWGPLVPAAAGGAGPGAGGAVLDATGGGAGGAGGSPALADSGSETYDLGGQGGNAQQGGAGGGSPAPLDGGGAAECSPPAVGCPAGLHCVAELGRACLAAEPAWRCVPVGPGRQHASCSSGADCADGYQCVALNPAIGVAGGARCMRKCGAWASAGCSALEPGTVTTCQGYCGGNAWAQVCR